MKKGMTLLLALALMLTGIGALGEGYAIDAGNAENFAYLLVALAHAYERPAEDAAAKIDARLDMISSVSQTDGALANAIAAHWRAVYLDPAYRLCVHHGEETAVELEAAGLPGGNAHAIVVLGYELKDGEMTDELKGRCDAAAALARSMPDSIIVCSGGPTGDNNPEQHTEAGMMKAYLVARGIDADRIHTDERAMTTVENAQNTMAMLREANIRAITIVTSTYQQRWGQAVYNAVSELTRLESGYSVQIAGNYCFETEPSHSMYKKDDRMAVRQLAGILKLPRDVMEKLQAVLK